jgi:hypothetical protein
MPPEKKFTSRVGVDVYSLLEERADQEGVSINTALQQLIRLGSKAVTLDDTCDGIVATVADELGVSYREAVHVMIRRGWHYQPHSTPHATTSGGTGHQTATTPAYQGSPSGGAGWGPLPCAEPVDGDESRYCRLPAKHAGRCSDKKLHTELPPIPLVKGQSSFLSDEDHEVPR